MVVIKYTDGSYEIQKTDKLEFKIKTLVGNEVETIFVCKNESDARAFLEAVEL